MGSQKLGKKDNPDTIYGERLFMVNGATFTIYYHSKRQAGPGGARTEYLGVGDVFLGDVQESSVASRVSMNIPVTEKKVPADPTKGILESKLKSYPAGNIVVTGYQF